MKIKRRDNSTAEYVQAEYSSDETVRTAKKKNSIPKRRIIISAITGLCFFIGMRDFSLSMFIACVVMGLIAFGIGTLGAMVLKMLPRRSKVVERILLACLPCFWW